MGKVLKYEVKWVDYPDKKDHTWEPEENLETAYESLEAYWKKIGGRPEPPSRKRKSVAAKETPEPKRRGRKPRQSLPSHAKNKSNADIKSETRDSDVETHEEWTPPNGSWEDHVLNVDVIEDNRDPTTAERSLYAYVIWHHGKKTRHPINTLRYKCPQKLLSYYEQHLVFKSTASDDGVEGVNPESIEA
ncbi:hypothetical protein EJ06DRAFT_531793 [Trichodelitschia bisporula]|uniref:Chromo domain-containing protein n=1 Tax=Trichodelitschia bisporula TaxID=703511 RepID=A0A6G1HRP8_9PEZI|nr:hypothetical protein EJ06DRAFT_531793 [Trichodelitschia bisporula]